MYLPVRRISEINDALLCSYDIPPPFLYRPQYLCPPEEVESQLPEQGINGIPDHLREPGPEGIVMEMREAEILLHDVTDFRDGPVPLLLMSGQFPPERPFS